MDDINDKQLFEVLFNQLVMSLSEAAMIQLGKLINPATGKTESNLAMARNTIDLLRMLKQKTANNLSEPENRLIEQSVLTLQMNYVYESDKAAAAAKPAEEKTPGPKEPDPTPSSGQTTDKPADDTPPGSRPGESN
jgi:hypothetical protein